MPGGSELVADRVEVVDFTVEHDPDLPVRGAHRLLTAGDVDNGEAAVTHGGTVGALLSVLVRPAMANCSVHPAQQNLIGQTIAGLGVCENEAAHGVGPKKSPCRS